jgi:hypothetical protein
MTRTCRFKRARKLKNQKQNPDPRIVRAIKRICQFLHDILASYKLDDDDAAADRYY